MFVNALTAMVCSCLQLANGLSFGMKETYMIPFNPFLAENESPVRDYLRLLSVLFSAIMS
jgi:hypothetical protein